MIQKLNLMLNYPVYWSDYKILRDFLQNFYDSKGYQKWWNDFSYHYENEILTLTMKDSGFSYEWLLRIGASSKTSSNASAGYYGEGFKIAALCAYRDCHWNITMSSQNWSLNVVEETCLLDGKEMKELAYDITDVPSSETSKLILSGITQKQYETFQKVLLSFFYPENPLLDQSLYEDEHIAVYTRSNLNIPEGLPITKEFGTKGIVFARYQMLGTLPYSIVIAEHDYIQKDRERNTLYDFDILKILYQIATQIDSSTAIFLLESIKDKWNSYPQKLVDIHTWYYIVCQLIRTLCKDPKSVVVFREKYPYLLYAQRILNDNIFFQNRRRIAKAWKKLYAPEYKIVMEQFKLLGYKELETFCAENNGFINDTCPTETEDLYIHILEDFSKDIFSDFFGDTRQIQYEVIRNSNTPWAGKATLKPCRTPFTNSHGIAARKEISHISIYEKYLKQDTFAQALSIYLHELSHMFGSDASVNFSHALTCVSEILIANTKHIDQYKKRWEQVKK